MYIDGNLVPIFAIAVGLIIVVVSTITKYKLKVEQIRADALVRAEEVRTRNQLELEKLLRQEQVNPGNNQVSSNETVNTYEDNLKSKGRVRE